MFTPQLAVAAKHAYARYRAYGNHDDTPAPPRRSAYTDDRQGRGAFDFALYKWSMYRSLMTEL